MKNKTILLFIVVALVQLLVPFQMIFEQEDILQNGTEFKFKTEPVDPNDPFRGKYITLNFEERTKQIKNVEYWHYGEIAYANLVSDSDGFAKIVSISKKQPKNSGSWLKLKIDFVSSYEGNKINFKFPFDRFYMNENKAPATETLYRESNRKTQYKTHAIVMVKNGEAVLKDVIIDGVPIKILTQKNNNSTP